MEKQLIDSLIASESMDIKAIVEKITNNKRISCEEGLHLFESNNLPLLGLLANIVRERVNQKHVFFNRNFHVEPTNICINHCKFCSYRRRKGQEGAWECSISEMIDTVKKYKETNVTEVHIVGGVHPDRKLDFYIDLLQQVSIAAPELHIKAFTAVEVAQMCEMSGVSVEEGLKQLKRAGLKSMPGGGAEIFDETLRKRIAPDKTDSAGWLKVHETAHKLGIPTNATMLYGLFESYEHRIDHLNRLRELQDKTNGFNVFIPLKFRNRNNEYSNIEESTTVEDLKNYAVSRIFLDNIPHLKAYWPMIGKKVAQLSLAFGVDDLDGTIDDSTKIYSMAGVNDQNPNASVDELIHIIKSAGFVPVERDTLFNVVREY